MLEKIWLRSSHLVFDPALSHPLFDSSSTVFITYKNELNALLVSPNYNTWFHKLHDAKECLLKEKDSKGTKSVAIREFILDYDLEENDRLLRYELNEQKKFLKISL